MAVYNNVAVVQTFASSDPQNAWANIAGPGWLKIKPGAADGVTNLFVLFNAAKANGKLVIVNTDAANQITYAYMV
ncbi:MAG TPA: hypothetical protein VJS44_06590 [Pyrinomonadaceae bacterium]|nr:hypothetical protein [Pyrinomonadaceae bacterium]